MSESFLGLIRMFAEVTGEKQNKFQLNRHFYLIFGKVKRKF